MNNGQMENKGSKKALIITISSIAAVFAVIGLIVFIILASKTTINLNDYLEISYTGYNGMGEADYDIDYKKLMDDFSEEIGLESENQRIRFELALSECVSGKLNKKSELSNGDNISFEWKVNEKVFQDKYKCSMEYTDVAEKISGLEEPVAYDPFEKLGVYVDGMAPSGQARIDESSLQYTGLNYTVAPASGLKNGDKIVVTVQYDDDVEKYCLSNGIKLTSTEKEYTVSGLLAYVTELDEIPEEQMAKMKTQAEDTFRAYVAQNWTVPDSLKAMNYIGSYLLNSKGNIGYGDAENYLYLVYKIDAPNSEGDLSYYYYTRYNNLIVDENGDCIVDISKYTVPTGGYHIYYNKGPYGEAFERGSYWYLGYETLDGLFNACVTANLEKYTYVSNVNE